MKFFSRLWSLLYYKTLLKSDLGNKIWDQRSLIWMLRLHFSPGCQWRLRSGNQVWLNECKYTFLFIQSSKKFPLFGILCLSISRRTKRNFWLRGKKKVFDKMFDEKLLFADFLWLAKPLKKLSGLFFGWGSLFDQTTNFCGDSLRLSFAWLRYCRISRSNWFSSCGREILFRLSERGRALNIGLGAHLVETFWHVYSIKMIIILGASNRTYHGLG